MKLFYIRNNSCIYNSVNDMCNIVNTYRHETSSSALYSKVATLSEYQVCRELLWMFYVQTSMVVFQQDNESKFSISSDISIPSLTTVRKST